MPHCRTNSGDRSILRMSRSVLPHETMRESVSCARKVLIVGGAGHLGRLLVEDLRRHADCELVVADRRVVDLRNPASIESALAGVAVAICAAGPFPAHSELPLCP